MNCILGSQITTGTLTEHSDLSHFIYSFMTVGNWYALDNTDGPYYIYNPGDPWDYHLNLNDTLSQFNPYKLNYVIGDSFSASKREGESAWYNYQDIDAHHQRLFFKYLQSSNVYVGMDFAGDNSAYGTIGYILYNATVTDSPSRSPSSSRSLSPSNSVSPSPSSGILTIPTGVEIVGIGRNSILNGEIYNDGILTNLTVDGTITGSGRLRLVANAASGNGSFISHDGKTVTVLNGLIISIV